MVACRIPCAVESVRTDNGAHIAASSHYHLGVVRLIDLAYWISLASWFAVAIAGGLAASAIFPLARDLPISMEGYEGFLAAEPELGRTLIAGFFAQSVFELTSRAQMLLMPIFLITVLLRSATGLAPSAWRTRVGRLALIVAVGASVLMLAWAMPSFDRVLESYRAAARGGDAAAAQNIKLTLDEYHSYSTALAIATAVSILILLATSSLCAPFRRRRDGASQSPRFVGVSAR